MPRDLADVLHHMIPEAKSSGRPPAPPPSTPPNESGTVRLHRAALPIVAVPIGDRDIVRAAFTWNLVFEVARLGGQCALVTPAQDRSSPLWPDTGVDTLGAEVIITPARDMGELYWAALDIAVSRAAEPTESGIILVRIPPAWLPGSQVAERLLRWTLLFTSSESRELLETYGLAKLLLAASPSARVGVTIHGARRMPEAQHAFRKLTRSAERHLGKDLVSYGMLVDDLDVYRAIVAQRPIGLAHPQSFAARTLRDVASLLLDDARSRDLD